MFNVFIKNYKNSSGSEVSTETTMFTIPTQSTLPITTASVSCSEDSADSFDFTMEQSSPYYNSMMQLKTLIRVVYNNTNDSSKAAVIFNGRVLTVNESTVYRTKKVHCEGCYGYMNDTFYPGKKESKREKITWSAYLDKIIANHNSYAPGSKDFSRGNVTINGSSAFTPTSEQRKYEPDSWTSTASLIGNLKSEFGGHFRMRTSGGLTAGASCTNYLDWYKYYLHDEGSNSRPTVKVTVNIMDLNSETNVDSIFTRLIPVGKTSGTGEPITVNGYKYTDRNGTQHTHNKKYIPVTLLYEELYTAEQLNDAYHSAEDYQNATNNFGTIYRVESFDGADTQEKLWNYAKKWIKDCYYGLATSFTVKAVDTHMLDGTAQKITVGERVNVVYKSYSNGSTSNVSKAYICKAATFDLLNPQNNSYTFGIPSEILKRTYSEGKKGGGDKDDPNKGGGGGGRPDNYSETFWTIAERIRHADVAHPRGGNDAADSFLDNGEMSGSAVVYDADTIKVDSATQVDQKDWLTVSIVGRIPIAGRYYIGVCKYGICGFYATRRSGLSSTTVPFATSFWYLRSGGSVSFTAKVPLESGEENDPATQAKKGWVAIAVEGAIQGSINAIKKLGIDPTKLTLSSEDPQTGTEKTGVEMNTEQGTGGTVTVNNGSENPAVNIEGNDGNNGAGKVTVNNGDQDPVVEVSGDDAKIEVNNPSNGRTAVSIDGKGKFIKMEKTSSGDWRIQLNTPITYTDPNGQTVTTDHTISASDFNVPSIPSFKTKLGVFDELIAGKATIGELDAAIARIEDLEASSITTEYLSSHDIYVNALIVTQYASAPYFSAGDYKLSGSNQSLLGSVIAVRVQPVEGSPNQYKLEYKTWASGDTWFVGGTFNRAGGVSSVVWGWASGKARATIYLQDGTTRVEYSPALDVIGKVGDPIWNDNMKRFRQSVEVKDENGTTVYTDEVAGTFDATPAWDDGYAKGAPTGVTLGSFVSGTVYNATIQRVTGDPIATTINCSAVFTKARQGYTQGIFQPAVVTLQGSKISPPIASANLETVIRINATASSFRRASSTKFYAIGDQVTAREVLDSGGTLYYKPSESVQYWTKGSSFTALGSAVTVTPIGTKYYYKRHPSSETPTDVWYSRHTSDPGGLNYVVYTAGAATTYYNAGSSKTAIGSKKTVTPVDTSSAIRVGSATTYYKRGTQRTEQGSSVDAYEKLSSGGTQFYQLGPLYSNVYNAGQQVTNEYYTKEG